METQEPPFPGRAFVATFVPGRAGPLLREVVEVGPGPVPSSASTPYQQRVHQWITACFGAEASTNVLERSHRFLEEALELGQACGATVEDARQLVEYVYGRPVGEPSQEVGGVMITLAGLCNAKGLDVQESGDVELARVWEKIEQIRAKRASKPDLSPLLTA